MNSQTSHCCSDTAPNHTTHSHIIHCDLYYFLFSLDKSHKQHINSTMWTAKKKINYMTSFSLRVLNNEHFTYNKMAKEKIIHRLFSAWLSSLWFSQIAENLQTLYNIYIFNQLMDCINQKPLELKKFFFEKFNGVVHSKSHLLLNIFFLFTHACASWLMLYKAENQMNGTTLWNSSQNNRKDNFGSQTIAKKLVAAWFGTIWLNLNRSFVNEIRDLENNNNHKFFLAKIPGLSVSVYWAFALRVTKSSLIPNYFQSENW